MSKHPPAKFYSRRYGKYVESVAAALQKFRAMDFVGEDTLEFEPIEDENKIAENKIALRGFILCRGPIVIEVTAQLVYEGKLHVSTGVQLVDYSYNVRVQRKGSIFRYDNAHVHDGHRDAHHKHLFNTDAEADTFEELPKPKSPIWVGETHVPLLREIIKEAYDWRSANYAKLPNPDSYPVEPYTR